MVLESLINLEEARKRPLWLMILSGFMTTISVLVASFLFPNNIGMFSVVFTTFALLPFMVKLMKHEVKEEELEEIRKKSFFQAHEFVLKVYTMLFVGEVLAYLILYMMLPQSIVSKIFNDQINQINLIRGHFTAFETYSKIVSNNLMVLTLAIILSFLYSSGAIFILSWNASILAAAIGITAKSFGGAIAVPLAILVFLPHGSLEILAYFLGGIAGGIISAEITRKKSRWMKYVFWDALALITLSILLIIVAGAVETLSIYLK